MALRAGVLLGGAIALCEPLPTVEGRVLLALGLGCGLAFVLQLWDEERPHQTSRGGPPGT